MGGAASARLDREELLQILRESISRDESIPVEFLMETETFRRAALTRRELLWRLRRLRDEGMIDLQTVPGALTFVQWHRIHPPHPPLPPVGEVTYEDLLRKAQAALMRVIDECEKCLSDPRCVGRVAEYYARSILRAAKTVFKMQRRQR